MIFLKAFIVGGLVCVIGQVLIDKTKLTPARILVLFVVAGVVLEAVGVFGALKDFAGAGVTVPLLGFGATMAEGTRGIIDEQGAIGIFTGPLTSGAGGITIAILSALAMALVSKPHQK